MASLQDELVARQKAQITSVSSACSIVASSSLLSMRRRSWRLDRDSCSSRASRILGGCSCLLRYVCRSLDTARSLAASMIWPALRHEAMQEPHLCNRLNFATSECLEVLPRDEEYSFGLQLRPSSEIWCSAAAVLPSRVTICSAVASSSR